MLHSRRQALRLSAGFLLACRDARTGKDASAPPPSASPIVTPSCVETHDNIEGPYYRANAPERANLLEPGMLGTPIEIRGRVTGLDCAARAPGLANVELDVWHATHDGHYDNDGTMRLGDRFLLRGRVRTDAEGRYAIRTIMPGRYLNGRQYRPAHVHVKLRAAGFAPLTTQLYFPGDPYNDVDPFIHRSLIMSVESAVARFDFVLRPAAG
ncbi:MAG: hypothetical protein KF819_14275 [Labilithrix sp.]|nr:hypothetical protein [Labilithrix sp.]